MDCGLLRRVLCYFSLLHKFLNRPRIMLKIAFCIWCYKYVLMLMEKNEYRYKGTNKQFEIILEIVTLDILDTLEWY